MISNKFSFPMSGEIKTFGYVGEIINHTKKQQLFDEKTWELLVNQFKIKSDKKNDWRGEFWGKMMRGACLTYRASKDEELYKVILNTVLDMLTAQEENGRFSTYPLEVEFNDWDLWCRKYIMLGFLYFIEICKSNALKRKIIVALKKHADYIVKHIGKGKNKRDILTTSNVYGTMNSFSILEPFVKLYTLTGKKSYFDFATYLVNCGCCNDYDLIEAALSDDIYPYQYKHTKAYEMMSCYEGVLEYYKVTGDYKYFSAVEKFIEKVVKTDYTIIGSSGCLIELFDNSTIKQTEPITEELHERDRVMQETCVTVTFIKLCAKMLEFTGDIKYASYIEKSGLNAMLGAVNNENQTMQNSITTTDVMGEIIYIPHESYPFDSYSPLYKSRRGLKTGGFKQLQDGRSYGCCAAIGSAGTAILGLYSVMKGEQGIYLNAFGKYNYKTKVNGKTVKINVNANVFNSNVASVNIIGNGEKFTFAIRIPEWAKDVQVSLNGANITGVVAGEYLKIYNAWGNEKLVIKYVSPVTATVLNGKVAFTKGPIVLARDNRHGEILPISVNVKNGKTFRTKKVKNDKFNSNLTLKLKTKDEEITLCDYAQAGKNYDDKDSLITVWHDIKNI